MYRIPQSQLDDLYREWIQKKIHHLELLQQAGFTRTEAIEMLKVSSLDDICSVMGNIG